MMTFYAGDHAEAEKLLDQTTRMGLDSKMFDCQTLVLLAFTRLENGDRKGLQRCHDDFARLIDKDPDNARQHRLADIVIALNLMQQHQMAQTIQAVRGMTRKVKDPTFDFESACNLMALLALLAKKAIQLDEVDGVVDTLGKRFCSNRSLTELLAASASAHLPYAERVRAAQTTVLEYAETAMSLNMAGDATAAVKNLLILGKETLNSRLIDNAYQLLQRNATKIADAATLQDAVQALRTTYGIGGGRASLGAQKRQAGGLALRTSLKVAT
jgi:hypothetical protein